jgi:hypothetical protein
MIMVLWYPWSRAWVVKPMMENYQTCTSDRIGMNLEQISAHRHFQR